MLSTQRQGQYVCKRLHTEQTDMHMLLSQCHMTQHQIRVGVRDTSSASLCSYEGVTVKALDIPYIAVTQVSTERCAPGINLP